MWLIMGGNVKLEIISVSYLYTGAICSCVYFLSGVISGVTIIGIPFALKQFALAKFCLSPFGKDLIETRAGKDLFSVVFLPFKLAAINFLTVFGIVFAEEHFRLALLAVYPLSKTVYDYSTCDSNKFQYPAPLYKE